jgi:hypothetical protein
MDYVHPCIYCHQDCDCRHSHAGCISCTICQETVMESKLETATAPATRAGDQLSQTPNDPERKKVMLREAQAYILDKLGTAPPMWESTGSEQIYLDLCAEWMTNFALDILALSQIESLRTRLAEAELESSALREEIADVKEERDAANELIRRLRAESLALRER